MIKIILIDCENTLRNYVFVIIDTVTNDCAIVDALNNDLVFDYLEHHQLNLKYILSTHHHNDHIGGNSYLKEKYNCKIYGHIKDANRITGITNHVAEGDTISLFDGKMNFQIIGFDGHTIGHIGFFEPNQKILFSGDTLFNLGCGRMFEGTAEQYHETMTKIKNLPDDTIIYGTHEYTIDNIRFTQSVIPETYEYYSDFLAYCNQEREKRKKKEPTIPFVLCDQKKFNPFLLTDHIELKKCLNISHLSDIETFAHLREMKNNT